MAWKSLIIVIAALCFFAISCYPDLSVQQYDKLKEDIVKLDEKRTELEQELAATTAELEEIKEKNIEVRAYVDFLVQLVSTQNSEGLLKGEFDINALDEAKAELLASAEKLNDPDIEYYISIINPENEPETAGAYYKAIEDCLKDIKQELAITVVNGNK